MYHCGISWAYANETDKMDINNIAWTTDVWCLTKACYMISIEIRDIPWMSTVLKLCLFRVCFTNSTNTKTETRRSLLIL